MTQKSFKLYYENIKILDDNRLYNKYYNIISVERRKKIDAYKFDRDKKLSLLAEVQLRKGLQELGIDISECEFLYGDNGKPYIKDKKTFYNISHSGEYAICGFLDNEIGVDIEQVKDIDLNIAKRFFYHSEYEDIFSQDSKVKQIDLFYRYWVLKESFMKCTGLGMKLPLDNFEIVIDGNDINVKQDFSDKTYSFFEKSDIIGYKVAICIEN